jgi:prepilin-type processing-associated H-X9-DG protein
MLRCPSDPGVNISSNGSGLSYAVCAGDTILNINSMANSRGVFGQTIWRSVADIIDGTSNTVGISEILCNAPIPAGPDVGNTAGNNDTEFRLALAMGAGFATPATCRTSVTGQYYTAGTNVRGRRGIKWTDAPATLQMFNTVLPPNSPACAEAGSGNFGDQNNSILPPETRHTGGAHCLFMDGAVRFISDNIDAGNASVTQTVAPSGQSAYGVWGALVTIQGGEAKSYE